MEELLNRKQLKGNDVELNLQMKITDELIYEFDYNTDTKLLDIQKIVLYVNGLMDTCEYLFQGIIKNKSELKKLLIQLNILTSAKNININSIN
jgi:hypothetical protein